MRTLTLTVLAAAAACVTAAPAAAQNFTGPSVGVQGGWQEEKVKTPQTNLGVLPIDRSRDSAVAGVFLGYDHELGRGFVAGVEGGFSIASSDKLRGGNGTTSVTIDPKRSFDATARAGYLVTPETLVYIRGGYANERIRMTMASASGTSTMSENRDGWLIGGGVERVLMPHVSARLEYRFTDLGDSKGTYDRHQVLAGVAYRF